MFINKLKGREAQINISKSPIVLHCLGEDIFNLRLRVGINQVEEEERVTHKETHGYEQARHN
jgi:hypothetical protein